MYKVSYRCHGSYKHIVPQNKMVEQNPMGRAVFFEVTPVTKRSSG